MKHIVLITRILQFQFDIDAADEHEAYRIATERHDAGFPGANTADLKHFHTIKIIEQPVARTITGSLCEVEAPKPDKVTRKGKPHK